MKQQELKGLTLDELKAFAEELGERSYRGRQLFSWIYGKRADSFDAMTDISKDFQSLLNERARIGSLEQVSHRTSPADGTTKFVFRLHDGLLIESVLIPPQPDSPGAERRLTLCVSTQVGCPLDCTFCATGTMGFTRNLSSGEIVDQFLQVQGFTDQRISNIVYMGMGEPLLNYDNVMRSVEILTSEQGPAIGARRLTVSTAGITPGIQQLTEEKRKVKLALSLHTLDESKRRELMPITKKYSLGSLLEALAGYHRKTKLRPTFEYILFDKFNDSNDDVARLAAAARRIPCKINLIPYHSIEFTHPEGLAHSLRPSPPERIETFAQALRETNVTVMVRASSGEDIAAACGQLALEGNQPISDRRGTAGGRRHAAHELQVSRGTVDS
jgi:23S rRNA (adenine2503-C2)-methyltransferase